MSTEELKKDIKKKGIIFGAERTIKALKNGKLEKIYIASNCKKETKDDILYYSKLSGVKVVSLKENNKETAIICKKPFNIAVLSMLKKR